MLVTVHRGAIAKMVELERKARETKDAWDVAYAYGFIEGLRHSFSSASIGLMICEAENILDEEARERTPTPGGTE